MMSNRLVTRNGNRLILPEKVNWGASIDLRKQLYNTTQQSRRSYFSSNTLTLDFAKVTNLYPNGMVPIIAEVHKYKELGHKFRVVIPKDAKVKTYFESSGWAHYLDKEYSDRLAGRGANTLIKFTSYDDLNNAINQVTERCMSELRFAEGAHTAFEWSLNEVADNVLNHSQAEFGWMQVVTYRNQNKLTLVVCDSGIGIRKSLSQAYEVSDDKDAIEWAIRKGVTRDNNVGQGNGLAGTLAIAEHSGGSFSITSGRGKVDFYNEKLQHHDHYPPFQGTFVEVSLPTDQKVDLPKALWGHRPANVTGMKFEDESGKVVLKLRDYATNFGNRGTGRHINMLLENLMTQNPGQAVHVDMNEIGIISSSFADELFGKLFIELGPTDYSKWIKPINLNDLCRELIDRAIMQRIGQSTGGNDVNESRNMRGRLIKKKARRRR